jgi:hypothetical protein
MSFSQHVMVMYRMVKMLDLVTLLSIDVLRAKLGEVIGAY